MENVFERPGHQLIGKIFQKNSFLQELILPITSLLEYIISQILSQQPYINLQQPKVVLKNR